jgi:GTPase
MRFIDETSIQVIGGNGGDGLVSFKSAKGRSKLGADGGDGGHGGSVFLIGCEGLNTLSGIRYKRSFRAEAGTKGGNNGCTGKCGSDTFIPVPLGTIASDAETGAWLGEILEGDQSLNIAQGGKRGLGNIHWLAPNHQAPREFRAGSLGEQRLVKLSLKLLADVGLCGLPNAGKSTLLSRVSNARPRIADYPFTTLVPNLGVVDVGRGFADGTENTDLDSFVVADVPGLIAGAKEGRGLGHKFLKHLERTKLIVYLIDINDETHPPQQALKILRHETELFSNHFTDKQKVIVFNKIDTTLDVEERRNVSEQVANLGLPVHFISCVTGEGIEPLKLALASLLRDLSHSENRTFNEPLYYGDKTAAELS